MHSLIKYAILLLMRDEYYFMQAALEEARIAASKDEVPIGAVIVKDGKIIARAHNIKESTNDSTAHAEMLAIQKASDFLGTWRLTDCDIYVTIEPCVMCAGAISHARIKRIIYGAEDQRFGGCKSLYNIPEDQRLNHRSTIVRGIYEEEALDLLRIFFAQQR